MTTLHCTYPDGETSEARYGLPLDAMIALYDPFYTLDEELTLVDAPVFEVPAWDLPYPSKAGYELGGEA